MRLKVAAPPVEGAANDEVRRFVADRCGVTARDVRLLAGDRSRDKTVLVSGRSPADVLAALLGG